MSERNSSEVTKTVAQTALFAALCYVGFQFLRIDIPVGDSKTAFHLGNAFCVLAALLLGGVKGGLAGAIGMTIADLTSGYVSSSPQTFIMKFMIGFIVGLVAHKVGHLSERTAAGDKLKWSAFGAAAGMAFNVIVDPVMSYLRKRYLLGMDEKLANIVVKWSALTTLVNAVLAVIVAVVLYNSLAPVLKKAGLLRSAEPKSADKPAEK
ncbi:MAG: ECF transporter S component [Firmicutes bacterium]|nr:ECF transporter S component [Bacillota bacterium]